MKLMTKEIERRLLKVAPDSTEELTPQATPVLVKFFDPTGRGTWYAVEGERLDGGDWRFFGYVVSPLGPECDEFGYFHLSELESVRGRMGLGIERDRYLGTVSLADAIAAY